MLDRIGPYAIYGEIASGGMASVHFARRVDPPGTGDIVALKRAHPHLVKETDFALMFFDEARLASRIDHPNVVRTIDVLNTPGDLALVMEYIHGESLWKLVRAAHKDGARIPAPIAVRIVADALLGLHAAHEATDEAGAPLGIVHRDVSPHNIIVGADGVARIVDFGIAKAAGRLHSTRDSSVKGKYAYMAPEQIRGEGVSRLTDNFAVGIVLWELLTGERLFAGKNEAETIHRCLVARVQAPSLFGIEIGAALDGVLRNALSRDPMQRYPTARAMAEDLASRVAPASADEVAAWVARVAGPALASQAAALRAIDAGDARQQAATIPDMGPPPSHPSAHLLEAHEPTPLPPRRGRQVALGIAMLGAVAGVTTALVLTAGSVAKGPARETIATAVTTVAAPPATSTAPPAPSASTAPPASTALPAPLAASSTAEVPSSVPVVALPSAPATTSAPPAASSVTSASPPPPGRSNTVRPPARTTVPSRPSRPSRPGCDPPYSIDREGRTIFKPECM